MKQIAEMLAVFYFLSLVPSQIAFADSFLNPGNSTPLMTTVLNPDSYVVSPPSSLDGVAELVISYTGISGEYGASGTLLAGGGGYYLLTAGHVIAFDNSAEANVESLTATFYSASGPVSFTGVSYYLAPGWNGDYLNGSDLAIVRLSSSAAGVAQGYNILTSDPSSSTWTGQVVGYGFGGYGSTGYDSLNYPFGTLRSGENTFGEATWNINGLPYAYDFDNGTSQYNTLTANYGLASDLGLGNSEAMISFGDSGGPTFYNGYIAGVHSFGSSGDPALSFSAGYGDLGGDTRVSAYADWVHGYLVPELPPGALLFTGLVCMALIGFRSAAKDIKNK
jgi:hypothetical protein